MRFPNLEQWLSWQETLHPKKIDLGLERVRSVARVMGLDCPRHTVVTIAGTNGKGSSVALLSAMLSASGVKVGSYISPHLLRYNERIRIEDQEVSDEDLCIAFERVDQARGDVTLSYFEFGTLTALDIFARQEVDLAILETGLGGRLDAVNILDADVALVTSVGIDHVEWLGADRHSIGREKAGIFRPNRPAVCADADPPDSVSERAQSLGARWLARGEAFDFADNGGTQWSWWSRTQRLEALPKPVLEGAFQLSNAAAVLMVLECLNQRFPVSRAVVEQGLSTAFLPGRMQVLGESPERILDVAHNPDAAQALVEALNARPRRRTLLVLAMLETKNVEGMGRALAGAIDTWYLAGLTVELGLSAKTLAHRLGGTISGKPVGLFDTVVQAYRQALGDAGPEDRVLVCGSFHTVAEVMKSVL